MPWSELYIHLVWATAGREPLVTADIEKELWAAVAAQCHKLGAEALQVGGMPDHVHVLVRYQPTLAISKLANEIKGMTSHLVKRKLAPGRTFKWQEGYGAFSLRKGDVPTVVQYIARQKEHHGASRLQTDLEAASE